MIELTVTEAEHILLVLRCIKEDSGVIDDIDEDLEDSITILQACLANMK